MKKSLIVIVLILGALLGLKFLGVKDIQNENIDVTNNPNKVGEIEVGELNSEIENTHPLINVSNVTPGQIVTSPMVVLGEARGYWYFEASFPIELVDENGNILVQTIGQAEGEWMTENFVPFEANLSFNYSGPAINGKLILRKDNPSGEPENDDSFEIPVVIQ